MLRTETDSETTEIRSAPASVDVQEMLLLVSQLQKNSGKDLDDEAINAVAEATGTPQEYVRLALRAGGQQVQRPTGKLRSLFLSFEPTVRSFVAASLFGGLIGVASATGRIFGDPSSFLGVIMVLGMLGGAVNAALSKDKQAAAISGAITGGSSVLLGSVFAFLISLTRTIPESPSPVTLIVFTAIGGVVGLLARQLMVQNRNKLVPQNERQQLLQQLVELQDKLRQGEQTMSFLCLDIVGSTRMKELADPLAVEFTFNEYHKYVEGIANKYGGRVHSTAGDGVTCAFDHPQQAFLAARNIQSGLIELNMHRNRLGTPIKLRAGIHHGTVLTGSGGIQNVNYAHVIDISAHLQKVAPEGGIAVSLPAAGMLPGGADSVGLETVSAQNVSARVWKPTAMPPGGLPPLPTSEPSFQVQSPSPTPDGNA